MQRLAFRRCNTNLLSTRRFLTTPSANSSVPTYSSAISSYNAALESVSADRPMEALEHLKEAIERADLLRHLPSTRKPAEELLSHCHYTAGNMYLQLGDFKNARSSWEQSLEFVRYPSTLVNLANLHVATIKKELSLSGKDNTDVLDPSLFKEAFKLYQQALELSTEEDPEIYANLALLHIQVGQLDEALEKCDKSVKLFEQMLKDITGEDDDTTAEDDPRDKELLNEVTSKLSYARTMMVNLILEKTSRESKNAVETKDIEVNSG